MIISVYKKIGNELFFVDDDIDVSIKLPLDVKEKLKKKNEIQYDGKIYKYGYVTRSYYLDNPCNSDWKELLELTLKYGEEYGDENVRVVVFFF